MSNGVKGKPNKDKFFTVEFWGVTLIVSAFLLAVCLLFGENVLFEIGKEVQVFILGLFGYLSYPLLLVLVFIGFTMLVGKKPKTNKPIKKFKSLFIFLFLFICLLTVWTGQNKASDYSSYLSFCFESARLGSPVAGGALFSLVTYFPVRYITYLGAWLSFLLLILGYLFLSVKFRVKKSERGEDNQESKEQSVEPTIPTQPPQNFSQPQTPFGYNNGYNAFGGGYPTQQPLDRPPFMQNGYQTGGYQSYERNELYGAQPNNYQTPYPEPPVYNDREKHEENMKILYGAPSQNTYSQTFSDGFSSSGLRVDSVSQEDARKKIFDDGVSSPIKKEEVVKDYTLDDSFSFNVSPKEEEVKIEPVVTETQEIDEPIVNSTTEFLKTLTEPKVENEVKEPIKEETQPEENLEYAKRLIENMPINYKYKKPPVSLFKTADNSSNNYETEVFKAEVKAKILTTLKTFGVDTEIPRVFKGPAVTRFDIAIPPNVPMSKVTKLQGDLNLRIAAKSAIRMIAPVPNTSFVGIEVPNKEADTVNIKDIIVSDQFINSKPFSLTFALGKDVIGTPVSLDLADMPHVLVTGTTGSGKSVCLNTLILSLITKYGPDELRFVIVDPKRVDLEPFKEIPHMMFGEIIEDVPMTNSMLTWAVEEMESRYRQLAAARAKNIKDFNTRAKANGERIMPRIVIIMDEFADIMLQDKKGVATKVCLLAQKARAAGIHLVLAAQRPSVDVVEGPIKSNLPARIVFRASSAIDSQVSLGEPGAEKLLGRGDCLYKTGGMLAVERVMGAYVSDEEMYAVIDYVSENNDKYFDLNNWSKIKSRVSSSTASEDGASSEGGVSSTVGGGEDGGIDPIYIKAMRVGYSFGGLSMSFLQRKLAVGFPKAGKIIDWLTDNGYITPNAVGGKRQMIMTKEDFEEKFGAE
ncbi:MAG: DUF87 domain-containing protein [Clostridia bacterium]|nr:DUF87 domain-containing protein [Clostridia bacterium]